MKLAWITWAGGIETRDDGWAIYHDPRWVMLKTPMGQLLKMHTAEDARRYVEQQKEIRQ